MQAHESAKTYAPEIRAAVQRLGSGRLTEQALHRHVHPLFSRVLHREPAEIYLANHSLGRPLDRMALDVQEAIGAWYEELDESWDLWWEQMQHFRQDVANLIHAPRADCIVPRASAGQGLRAVLNACDDRIIVLTSQDEFDSIDFILKVYANRGRIALTSDGGRHPRRRARRISASVPGHSEQPEESADRGTAIGRNPANVLSPPGQSSCRAIIVAVLRDRVLRHRDAAVRQPLGDGGELYVRQMCE